MATIHVHRRLAERLAFDDAAGDLLRASLTRAYPLEGCGLLLGNRRAGVAVVRQFVHTPNVAPTERRRRLYTIDPLHLLHWQRLADRQGLDVLGIAHSHPDCPPVPSATDTERAWAGFVYLIARTTPAGLGEVRAYTVDDAGEWDAIQC